MTVRPAIDGNQGDVTRRVEALRTQHAAEPVADLLFECRETGRKQLGAPSTVPVTLRKRQSNERQPNQGTSKSTSR
jgi:hypothetical protein